MVDFNLAAYKVTKDNVMEYPLIELAGEPVLVLRSATEGNADYLNGIMRATGVADGGRRKEIVIDAAMMEETLEHDKALYPECVIVGWSGVIDSEGNKVKFSKKNVREFIEQLPDWIFNRVRTFATKPENFVNKIDSVGKAKN